MSSIIEKIINPPEDPKEKQSRERLLREQLYNQEKLDAAEALIPLCESTLETALVEPFFDEINQKLLSGSGLITKESTAGLETRSKDTSAESSVEWTVPSAVSTVNLVWNVNWGLLKQNSGNFRLSATAKKTGKSEKQGLPVFSISLYFKPRRAKLSWNRDRWVTIKEERISFDGDLVEATSDAIARVFTGTQDEGYKRI